MAVRRTTDILGNQGKIQKFLKDNFAQENLGNTNLVPQMLNDPPWKFDELQDNSEMLRPTPRSTIGIGNLVQCFQNSQKKQHCFPKKRTTNLN